MAIDNLDVTPSGRTRQEKTKRTFIDAQGEASPRTRLDSIMGRIEFVSSKEVLEFAYYDLSAEIARAAALFGIMTSVTNTVGKAGMSEDEMFNAAKDRLDTILDGEWSSDTRSGPRSSDLVEAYARACAERNFVFTDEKRVEILAALANEDTGGEFKARMLSKTAVKAHFEAIKAERAAERAAKAKTAAQADNQEDDLDL